jgi:uncharacterized protein (DUF433 family)
MVRLLAASCSTFSFAEGARPSLRGLSDCLRPCGYQLLATPGKRLMTPADRITINRQQCGGRPCVRGMRIRVSDVLDLLAAGVSPAEVMADLPDLEIEDVIACLKFASLQVSQPGAAA